MNKTINNFAKTQLKELLKKCSEPQILMFKRMYCHKNLEATIEEAVDQMDEEKVENAMNQVERTLSK